MGAVGGRPRTAREGPRSGRSLALEKHFLVEGREVVLEERIVLCGEDQLSLATTLRAPGDCEAPVCDAGDREILCNNLDAAARGGRTETEGPWTQCTLHGMRARR